jgi:hypothetical protein
MITEIREQAQRRDRWVSWLVIGVLIAALLLGWAVKAAAEGRTVLYQAGGLQVRYPAGWVRAEVQPPVLLRVEDRWAAPFRTTLMLQRRPLPPVGEKPVGTVQQTLALERGRKWTAYRVLGMEENVSIAGRTGMRVTFAYVETNPNPFLETVPVVMSGEDFLFPVGDQVYIVTLTAAEANHARAQRALRAFLRSLEIER